MSNTIKAACVQLNTGPNVEDNLKAAETIIREAAGQGAKFIATPENTDCIYANSQQKVEKAGSMDTHPGLPLFSALAKELSIHLLIGSLAIKEKPEDDRVASRSFLFGPDGEIIATYDKIHLYDVDLPTGESHRESTYVKPGENIVVADMGAAKLGPTICYDLRFPHIFRDLAKAGAGIITVPSAFTVPTGKAHWHILLRARAIETGCFILAPAQAGEHVPGRASFGHSLIIAPWGEILAELPEGTGYAMADLNLDEIEKVRAAIPALQHDREYEVIK